MRLILLAILTIIPLLLIEAQAFDLDSEESTLTWTGYGEIGGYSQSGSIMPSEGMIEISDEKITNANLVIDMESISSTESDLTRHLKAKDFFYVKKYPTSEINLISYENGIMVFELSMRGITKQLETPVEQIISDNSISIKGNIEIDRTEFEIKYNSSSYFQDLGSYAIKNKFDLAFDLYFKLTD